MIELYAALIFVGIFLFARAALQVVYEITNSSLMYFELVQLVGVIASMTFLIQMLIECKPVTSLETIEDFLAVTNFFDLKVIDQAFTRFIWCAMSVFIGTPFRIIYWVGVQYPERQLALLVNNFYMLSPFLKQALFVFYLLRFAEAFSMHLLIGTELP